MKLDKELHRQILLELLQKASCPVPMARDMVDLVSAIEAAQIEPQSLDEPASQQKPSAGAPASRSSVPVSALPQGHDP